MRKQGVWLPVCDETVSAHRAICTASRTDHALLGIEQRQNEAAQGRQMTIEGSTEPGAGVGADCGQIDWWRTDARDISTLVRGVSSALMSGVAVSTAWSMVTHEESGDGIPDIVRDLGKPVPFPGVSRLVGDMPQILRFLAMKEKLRSDDDRVRRMSGGVNIAQMRSREALPEPTRSEKWWRGRSMAGQLRAQAVGMLCTAMDFHVRVGASPAQVLSVIAQSIDSYLSGVEGRHCVSDVPLCSPNTHENFLFDLTFVAWLHCQGYNIV